MLEFLKDLDNGYAKSIADWLFTKANDENFQQLMEEKLPMDNFVELGFLEAHYRWQNRAIEFYRQQHPNSTRREAICFAALCSMLAGSDARAKGESFGYVVDITIDAFSKKALEIVDDAKV